MMTMQELERRLQFLEDYCQLVAQVAADFRGRIEELERRADDSRKQSGAIDALRLRLDALELRAEREDSYRQEQAERG